MNVSPATWNALSRLLDEAFDLEPDARGPWLEQLAVLRPDVAPALCQLLAAHATGETTDVLSRLPALSHTVGGAPQHPGLAKGDRVGPYVLLRVIGGGGMADVWLARRDDGAFDREVALKLPLVSSLRRDLAIRFARERDILARLEHPNIARLYDAGVSADGLPYLAMEYVDGLPLTTWCDERRLGLAERLQLFAQVLAAVQFAHANLIIHRDLKPSNILVTGDGHVSLLDFGIAKLLAAEDRAPQTELSRWAGRALTPDYASPEQIKGEPLTIASDVYSLGVVLFELLTGTRPYQLKVHSVAQLEEAIVSAEPLQPSSTVTTESAAARGVSKGRLTRQLGGELDTILLEALGKSPARRYPTVAALAEDLRRHLRHEPVVARPPSTSYRVRKYLRRHLLGVGVAATLVVLLTGFAASTAFQARRIARERDRANAEAAAARQVSGFLTSMFQLADPSEARGNSITAREVLDRAAREVQTALAQQPELQARMTATLGEVYKELGLYPQASALTRASLDTRTLALGPEATDTLESTLSLASILREQGKPKEAESLVRPALDIADRRLGPESLLALRMRSLLDWTIADGGELATAERMSRETLATMERVLGSKHRVTWKQRGVLSIALERQRRFAEALPINREVLATAEESLGPDAPDTLVALGNLAASLSNLGRRDEALPLMRELVERQRRVLGPEHPRTLSTLDNLAVTLKWSKQLDEADAVARQVVEVRRRVLGPEHRDTVGAMEHLALISKDRGKLAEAEATQNEVVAIRARALGASNHLLADSKYNLACILAQAGKRDRAIEVLRDAVDHGLLIRIAAGAGADSDFQSLRGDSRFQQLVEEIRQRAVSGGVNVPGQH